VALNILSGDVKPASNNQVFGPSFLRVQLYAWNTACCLRVFAIWFLHFSTRPVFLWRRKFIFDAWVNVNLLISFWGKVSESPFLTKRVSKHPNAQCLENWRCSDENKTRKNSPIFMAFHDWSLSGTRSPTAGHLPLKKAYKSGTKSILQNEWCSISVMCFRTLRTASEDSPQIREIDIDRLKVRYSNIRKTFKSRLVFARFPTRALIFKVKIHPSTKVPRVSRLKPTLAFARLSRMAPMLSKMLLRERSPASKHTRTLLVKNRLKGYYFYFLVSPAYGRLLCWPGKDHI